MLTKFQSHLFNYCLDSAITYYGKWYKTDAYFDRSTIIEIIDLFQYSVTQEENYENATNDQYKNMSVDDRKLAGFCLEKALEIYKMHYGVCRIDIREHRVKVREIYIKIVSNKFREKQLEGLELTRQKIAQEKEALLHEGL